MRHDSGQQRGGYTALISVTPTVEAGAYATGDLIGGKMTIAKAARHGYGSGIIQSIIICSKIALTAEFDIVFFSSDPTGTTFTENGAIAVAAADAAKVIGNVTIVSSADDYVDLGTPDVITKANIGLPFEIAEDGRDLYAAAVLRGSHTPGSTSDLTFRFGILQD